MGNTPYLWAFASVAVAFVGVLFGLVPALMSRPSRRLDCKIVRISHIGDTERGTFKLEFAGQPLRDPYLVEISIRNTGRRAIPSNLFSKGNPLRIDLESSVKAIVDASGSGLTSPLDIKSDDSELILTPQLIIPGRKSTYSILVDGKPSISFVSSLINVQVRTSGNDYESTGRTLYERNAFLLAVATLLAVVASIVVAIWGR